MIPLKRGHNLQGFSLVELVIAIAIVMVLATGGLSYLYHSNMGVKKSEAQTTAARLASLLLNSWKGNGGDPSFNPITAFESRLSIKDIPSGPAAALSDYANRFSDLGSYHILVNNINYYVTMAYSPATSEQPLTLSTCVAWRPDYKSGEISENDPSVRLSVYAIP